VNENTVFSLFSFSERTVVMRAFKTKLFITLIAVGLLAILLLVIRQNIKQRNANLMGRYFVVLMEHINNSYKISYLAVGDYPLDSENPISSWRFSLRFYSLENEAFIFNEPWDSIANQEWARTSENPFPTLDGEHTYIVAITGPDTFFDEVKNLGPTAFDEDTIVLVEVRNSGIHWMQPGDLSIESMPKTIDPSEGLGISGNLPGGFHVAFADGQAWFLSNDVPFEDLQRFFTREGALKASREELLEPYCIRKFLPD